MGHNDRPALSSFRGGAFGLRPGMRQRRQLGKRRANATMVSRLAACFNSFKDTQNFKLQKKK